MNERKELSILDCNIGVRSCMRQFFFTEQYIVLGFSFRDIVQLRNYISVKLVLSYVFWQLYLNQSGFMSHCSRFQELYEQLGSSFIFSSNIPGAYVKTCLAFVLLSQQKIRKRLLRLFDEVSISFQQNKVLLSFLCTEICKKYEHGMQQSAFVPQLVVYQANHKQLQTPTRTVNFATNGTDDITTHNSPICEE